MALTYTTFKTYPLIIADISADDNAKIQAIETFVIADINLVGSSVSLTAILPYFVFWYFLDDAKTTVMSQSGENLQVKEYSEPAIDKQVRAWNLGVDKFRAALGITEDILTSTCGLTIHDRIHNYLDSVGITVNENYLSKISLI